MRFWGTSPRYNYSAKIIKIFDTTTFAGKKVDEGTRKQKWLKDFAEKVVKVLASDGTFLHEDGSKILYRLCNVAV